jgi:YVTN family beta-propeller protein
VFTMPARGIVRTGRRHLLRATGLACALVAAIVAAPADGATPKSRDAVFVGNNWDGTATVFDPHSFRRLARINIIPDLRERMTEIQSDPERLGYFLAIRELVGEGHDQFVDDMFSSHDGRFVYVSRPSLADVVGIDLRTRKIVWRVKVEGQRADHMGISPDGRQLLVSASTARKVHVIDPTKGKIVGNFESGDQPHENNFSRDGKLVFHASIGTVYTPSDQPAFDSTKGDRWFEIVDARTLKVLRRINMGEKLAEAGYKDMSSAVRPMALSPDERTVYFQVSFFHGFVEYDLVRDRVLRLARLPVTDKAPKNREEYLLDSAHHGLAMNPEGTKLCAAGTMSDYAAIVSRKTFAYKFGALGRKPYWSTNSADGRYCYVSFSGDDRVAVISYRSEKEIASIPVGDHPQRVRAGKAPLDVGCLGRRARLSRRGLGPVRLGLGRRALGRRIPLSPVKRTRRSLRWCVAGGRGNVVAAFSRGGRVQLALSTAPSHGNRGVRRGRSANRLRSAYPNRVRLARGLYRANPRSRLVIGLRGGRVRFVAVASRALLRSPRLLRGYARLAGVPR